MEDLWHIFGKPYVHEVSIRYISHILVIQYNYDIHRISLTPLLLYPFYPLGNMHMLYLAMFEQTIQL